MNITKSELIITAGNKKQFPDNSNLEIAFAGKSNVGKSSLINTLINRKTLARTSSHPGKTQTINFYNIQDTFNFVDLPGYGYARVSKTLRENWGKFIEEYLSNRNTLKQVILLVDIRHAPSENDKLMYDWISFYHKNVIIVATKMDKLKKSQIPKHISIIKDKLNLRSIDSIIPFSATNKTGKEEIWKLIDNIKERD
ncbi:MAG: YihA family ribosome biogenesis GTP-binding protein [Candidatus Epulonipiscioides saccharophilum]|nr:MAG: YihA family ribosome biogenesis GTP-binding protein [Epulopiscium sp. AS2M-Bin001]